MSVIEIPTCLYFVYLPPETTLYVVRPDELAASTVWLFRNLILVFALSEASYSVRYTGVPESLIVADTNLALACPVDTNCRPSGLMSMSETLK